MMMMEHSTQVTAPAQCADNGTVDGDCQDMSNAMMLYVVTPARPETASWACQSARKGVT